MSSTSHGMLQLTSYSNVVIMANVHCTRHPNMLSYPSSRCIVITIRTCLSEQRSEGTCRREKVIVIGLASSAETCAEAAAWRTREPRSAASSSTRNAAARSYRVEAVRASDSITLVNTA